MSGNPPAAATPDAALAARLARFAPVEIRLDLSFLPASEQAALAHLVAAARLMDPIFLLQTWAGNPALAARLDGAAKSLFEIHGGPWDRIDEQPFVAVGGKPAGAGFYPEDLGKDEFDRYAAAHPDQADALKGLTTVVSRDASDRTRLVATPYSQAYREWLEPAARELEAAADATRNASLAKFCRSRAAAFRDDRYMQSDIDWMDLDSPLEATIGPYETYEDGLFGYKAAFEAFITVCDPAESKKLAIWKSELPAMEMNLPIPEEMKNKNRGSDSPIRLVDVVRTGGEARFGVQTIAFNLPNDETVREMKGSKKVLLRNFIRAKFDRMLRPIASRMLRADQVPLVTADAFTNQTLFHELSHGLGPGKIVVNGQPTEVRLALKELYSAIEEAKADVMGVYNLFFMMKKGLYPADQKNALGPTYLAGLFRSIRFGTADAHGKANAIQFNWMMKNGAISRDADGRYSIDFAK